MGDLEKLLGKKLELEALELASDQRPAGHFNDGQRAWKQPENNEDREIRAARESRAPREGRGEARTGGREPDNRFAPGNRAPRAPRAPADPLFDKPYEPSASADAKPSWEASQPAATRGLSPNIKTRKKLPALFKSASVAAPVPAAPALEASAPTMLAQDL
jgi:ATP-dependent RNA helicase RhlE